MQPPRPHLPAIAPQLPGHTVLLADGEQLGVVADVVQPDDASVALVVKVENDLPDLPSDALLVPDAAVHTVTDGEVVLGTTARWLGHHAARVPSPEDGLAV